LSNGNLHYFWDLQRGNPNIISKFPKPETVIGYTDFKPNAETLINETVNEDYIVKTQKPDYEKDPRYIDEVNDLLSLKKTNFVFKKISSKSN
jgi:type I restriction enzyme R subunit